jgi:hypothetical protein
LPSWPTGLTDHAGWSSIPTSRAFTNLSDAQQEEADAHSAGKVNERVFEFRPARRLAAVPD